MSEFTKQDAEDAGWVIVHEGIEEEVEGATLNASHWRAEKYLNEPGRAGAFVEVAAPTEDRLYESIATREQQFSSTGEGTVLLPAEGVEDGDVSLSEPDDLARVEDADYSDASNDVLLVLSDPSDPDSDVERKVMSGGTDVTDGYETNPENVPAPSEPLTDDDGNLLPAADATARADAAAIEEAKSQRDQADSVQEADGADAAAAVAQARHDALTGDPGDSGNDGETVQPEAGAATDASDSEQQSQVRDSEAAESDTERTNTDLPGDKPAKSQDEITGPDSDATEPLRAPNAAQGEVPAGTGQPIDPNHVGDAEVTGPTE